MSDQQLVRGSQCSSVDVDSVMECVKLLESLKLSLDQGTQASTRSICGTQSPKTLLPVSKEDKPVKTGFKPRRKRNRVCDRNPGSTSQERKSRIWKEWPSSLMSRDRERSQDLSSSTKKQMMTSPTPKKIDLTAIRSPSEYVPSAFIHQTPQEKSSKFQSYNSTLRWKGDNKNKKEPKIWIIGSSYIKRGEVAAHKLFGENLGLNARIMWFGKGGMRWSGVLPCFQAQLSQQTAPDILVIHAGGNDLGLTSAEKLLAVMKDDLMQLHYNFPLMRIVYSSINERKVWRNGNLWSVIKDRKTINVNMRKSSRWFGDEFVHHPGLRHCNPTIFLPDGIHLNCKGNRIFLTSIRRAIERIL